MWFIRVEVEQETSAPPPKKNPGSAPDLYGKNLEQEKYRHMIKEFNDFSNEVGYDIISYCNNEITLVTRRIDPDSQTIVISDDFVREKNQKKLVDYFMQGRNKNCSVFFILVRVIIQHQKTPD